MFDAEDALTALDDHMHRVESKQYGPVWDCPSKVEMTDTERLDFLGEYCKYEQKDRHYVITDCLGQRTEEMDFREAIDIAAVRFYAANE